MDVAVRLTGIVFALLSAALFGLFAILAFQVSEAGPLRFGFEWIPALGLSLSFFIDGLSILFALVITGVGFFIFVYSQEYLCKARKRVFWIIFIFLLSMLGIVCSDNLILTFIFWELTSITSYLLIGLNHEEEESRFAALQALIVTGGAGLALLAGILLIYSAAGTVELSDLLLSGKAIQDSPLYLPILILVLVGAFAKSAQFPLHFWLPGAMTAPTPVSAFLHSATMVKAGIYLMARLHPVLGGSNEWQFILLVFGGITMVSGALIALPQPDLKKLLAYTTVSALGIMTFLLGLGTATAIQALLVYIVIHALYKAALFLIIGAIDHEAGTRELKHLGGLRRAMPITFVASLFAVFSMCGIPPFLGFIGKELIYEAQLHSKLYPWLLLGSAFLANLLTVTAAVMAGVLPFIGKVNSIKKPVHEAPFSLWIGPLVLGTLALIWGIWPGSIDHFVVSPAFLAISQHTAAHALALWHGFGVVFFLSLATLALGLLLLAFREKAFSTFSFLKATLPYGPAAAYKAGLSGFIVYSGRQTRFFQNGSLHRYMAIILGLFVIVLTAALLSFSRLDWPQVSALRPVDVAVIALIVIPALAAIATESRLASVLELSAVGLGVTLLWVLYGAPDLALTQILVETLTFVLIMLMIKHLPKYREAAVYVETTRDKLVDALISFIAGASFCLLVLQSRALQVQPTISDYFANNASLKAHGRNVVNVILVDFRGLDTLGEITVVGLAALGVIALLQMRKSPYQENVAKPPNEEGPI